MSDLALSDLSITGIEDHPVTDSVKIWGPPGTGKTTQSAGRVGRLLAEHGYSGYDVTWSTYRKSLAMETIQRLVDWGLIPDDELDSPAQGQTRTMGTIHSIGRRIMRDDLDVAGTGRRIQWANDRGISIGWGGPDDVTVGSMFFDIQSWMRSNLLDPRDPAQLDRCPKYSGFIREHPSHSIPQLMDDWDQFKRREGLMDFEQMLEAPLENNRHPETPIVVIDEYHDVTPLMAALAEQWVGGAEIAIVAGDPNQVVNAHEGASPEHFRRLDLPTILLDETWRVPERHWRIASRVLSRGADVPPVRRKRAGAVRLIEDVPRFQEDQEGRWTEPRPGTPRAPDQLVHSVEGSIMFVARTQKQIEAISTQLSRSGIPNVTQSGVGGWNTTSMRPVRHLHNALGAIEPLQPEQFSGRTYGLNQWASDPEISSDMEILPVEEAETLIYHTPADLLAKTRKDLERLVSAWRDTHGEDGWLSGHDLHEAVELEFWDVMTQGSAAVDRLLQRDLGAQDREILRASLAREDLGRVELADVDVSAMTIHASKGQEAEHVVVYDGITKRIREAVQTDESAWRNECRTWFVGLTRASECLHVVHGGFEWTTPWIQEDLRAALASEQTTGSTAPADD